MELSQFATDMAHIFSQLLGEPILAMVGGMVAVSLFYSLSILTIFVIRNDG